MLVDNANSLCFMDLQKYSSASSDPLSHTDGVTLSYSETDELIGLSCEIQINTMDWLDLILIRLERQVRNLSFLPK